MNIKDAKIWKYPAGEVGVRLEEFEKQLPTFMIRSSDDLLACFWYLQAKSIQSERIEEIYIPYMPYSRQDRVINKGDPLPLQIIAHTLRSLGVKIVHTDDMHSEAGSKIFAVNNITLKSELPKKEYKEFYNFANARFDNIKIVCPDNGAKNRVQELTEKHTHEIIYMCKKRNEQSGKIENLDFLDQADYDKVKDQAGNTLYLIVDDICDGGGTFLGLAQCIKEVNPKATMALFVTHGIFSQGFTDLNKHFAFIRWKNKI